ncbi:MAG: hypothetical protein COX43_00965 [Parcubacteria group bacterium CG23_combo_of_CG06-09_8_20_14_all_35_9]|nr:MAG: hypothetical protein COX43_00965 [Parcubacteria group bacterium CG23_combo_of_CG06-09_8_20_14_all_35_9]
MTLEAIHVRFEGLTASFRQPLIISGTQLTLPVPLYSTLLGLISACANRIVGPKETRIGFEFHCESISLDLERTRRFGLKNGRLHEEAQGIVERGVCWHPKLDLYLTDVKLFDCFRYPASTPCLGRSQDIAWIRSVRKIELAPAAEGDIGPTLIPAPQTGVPGYVVRCTDSFSNVRTNYPRNAGSSGIYQAMDSRRSKRFRIKRNDLYSPSDSESGNAIYLHKWTGE